MMLGKEPESCMALAPPRRAAARGRGGLDPGARQMLRTTLCLALAQGAAATKLVIDVAKGGSYAVSVQTDIGEAWLESRATWFSSGGKIFSSHDGSLTLKSNTPVSGTDAGGAYTGASMLWGALDGTPLLTSIRTYAEHAIFTQTFPDGVKQSSTGQNPTPGSASTGRDGLVSAFPTFAAAAGSAERGVVSFQGDMDGSGTRVGKWGPVGMTPVDRSTTANLSPSPPATGECRVTVGNDAVHPSSNGYTAFTPTPDYKTFNPHAGDFCACEAPAKPASCSHWAYHRQNATMAACEAQCTKLKCSCFDFKIGGGGGGHHHGSSGTVGSGISGSGPVVLFSMDLSSTLVLSAASNFMAASQTTENNTLLYGVMGAVTSIPANYSVSTIVALSSGVNQAMEDWGSILLKTYGKQRYAYKRDPAMQQLGYSTE
jgi:hypothetical protein